MTAHGGGNILNVASISGITADANGTLYGASKAGVINLTKYIATQMGKKNIRCNAVAPGLVLTPAAVNNLNEDVRNIFLGQCATPYLGEPEDVAATIAFLASNDARYITGQTIVVDGGLTIHNPTSPRNRSWKKSRISKLFAKRLSGRGFGGRFVCFFHPSMLY